MNRLAGALLHALKCSPVRLQHPATASLRRQWTYRGLLNRTVNPARYIGKDPSLAQVVVGSDDAALLQGRNESRFGIPTSSRTYLPTHWSTGSCWKLCMSRVCSLRVDRSRSIQPSSRRPCLAANDANSASVGSDKQKEPTGVAITTVFILEPAFPRLIDVVNRVALNPKRTAWDTIRPTLTKQIARSRNLGRKRGYRRTCKISIRRSLVA